MFASSLLLWLGSLVVFVIGVVFLFTKGKRPVGVVMVLGSVGMWVVSMGMCVVAIVPDEQAPRDKVAIQPSTEPPPADTPVERDPGKPPAPAEPRGQWKGGAGGSSPRDDSPTVSYLLESPDDIAGWLTHDKPRLVIRCQERRTEVYVDIGMSASVEFGKSKRHTVRVRFDDAPASREEWSDSTDDKALFAPNPIALARRAARAKTLAFEFTPFNAGTQVATFALTGSDAVVAHVAATCGWTP